MAGWRGGGGRSGDDGIFRRSRPGDAGGHRAAVVVWSSEISNGYNTMPLTPLHFGVLAPIHHWFPGRVSLVSFTLVNLWMDGNAILYFGFGLDRPDLHGPTTHSLLAAVVMAAVVSLFGVRSSKWVLGAFVGGLTHVLLDMLVHPEMQPLYPLHWNPFYAGLMQPLSLVLLPLMIWFIVQSVARLTHWLADRRTRAPEQP